MDKLYILVETKLGTVLACGKQMTNIMRYVPGMLTPPRGKKGCPALPREKQALPRPAEIDKTRGRNGAKLTVDYTDNAHTFGLRVGK